MTTLSTLTLAALFTLSVVEGFAIPSSAQEPPAESTETVKPATLSKAWTEQQAFKKAFGAAVEAYLEAEAAKTGGVYTLKDEAGQDLKLVLVRVHKHRINNLGGDDYSALADLKGADSEKVKARVEFTAHKTDATFSVTASKLITVTGQELK